MFSFKHPSSTAHRPTYSLP
ncbi:CRISPR-associated protein Cas5 [Candidatus Amesbacteria bacterium]|nr:CRISPR-associated protein Cas5 [Candidatus Amesbacteria bacterium]